MNKDTALRACVYSVCVIPAFFLFIEDRVLEAGAIGWLTLVVVAIGTLEVYLGLKKRKAANSPPSTSHTPAEGLPIQSIETIRESLPSLDLKRKLEYDMDSSKEWCPLDPRELIDYVSKQDSTSISQERRSAMYEGKLLRARGYVVDVEHYLNSYHVCLHGSNEHPSEWTIFAEMRSNQNEFVEPLRKADYLTVTGTIESISNHVRLEDSYIDHSATIPHPKNLVEPLDETNVPAWFIAALSKALKQIDDEEDDSISHRLLNVLDRNINEMSDEVSFLNATRPRGEELRFMYTLLSRWIEHSPTYPKFD